ncbi:2'-5' RNA ligase family protein [Actinoallomurus acaciae]|uniref:2'-5' RNA ligase family protein n=1 Tax=Actinoallomurus acaciae TaxID=502577 RepID=A0ABV5YAT5_9ACTN
MSPLPERMTDHWWWRPGVRPGRRLYVWHILFDDQPEVVALAQRCQAMLTGISGLDLVPEQWLHMTTQIIGFADEIDETQVNAMCEAATKRLEELRPVRVSLGRALFHSEAVMLGIRPGRALDPMRDGLRSAVASTVRAHQLAGRNWTPHMTLAYSNQEGPAAPAIEAMREAPPAIDAVIRQVSLASQERVGRLYRWDRLAVVPLGIR